MAEIYFPDSIKNLTSRSEHLVDFAKNNSTLKEYFNWYAEQLIRSRKDDVKSFVLECNNYYKPFLGKPMNEVLDFPFEEKDFFDIACHGHGFQEGISEEILNQVLNFEYETAVQLCINGQTKELSTLLKANPTLATESSAFGHRAQLIHYCSSNAVEIYRQQVPMNLLEVVKELVSAGANPQNKIPVYGGQFDFFDLFHTSAHPKAAKIYDDIVYHFKED